MPSYYEIPLIASPQTFLVTLAGVSYSMTLKFCSANAGIAGAPTGIDQEVPTAVIDTNNLDGWVLDISDALNNPLVSGIPLIPGVDLMAQYVYLGIGGQLIVSVDGDPDAVPDFIGLGSVGHLNFVTLP